MSMDCSSDFLFVDPTVAPFRRALLNEIVAPRPIAWISTLDAEGRANLAPFSHFNVISSAPPMVMFACNTPTDRALKDTVSNAIATKEFVVNMASYPQRDEMVETSAPMATGIDEFAQTGIAQAASRFVRPPRVALAPASLECRLERVIIIPGEGPGESDSQVVFGRVVGIQLRADLVDDRGRFQTLLAQPLGRLGGVDYVATSETFTLPPRFRARD